MKLNSIRYGPKFLSLIGLLTMGIPAALYLCHYLLERMGIQLELLHPAILISVAIGLGLLAIFLILLVVEFVQDQQQDIRYRQSLGNKVKISDGIFECPYCGSRKVREQDTQCGVCGKTLRDCLKSTCLSQAAET